MEEWFEWQTISIMIDLISNIDHQTVYRPYINFFANCVHQFQMNRSWLKRFFAYYNQMKLVVESLFVIAMFSEL